LEPTSSLDGSSLGLLHAVAQPSRPRGNAMEELPLAPKQRNKKTLPGGFALDILSSLQ
jgi:hypothetical protein